jgi:hypothetical protein
VFAKTVRFSTAPTDRPLIVTSPSPTSAKKRLLNTHPLDSDKLNRTRSAIGTLGQLPALSVSVPEKFRGGLKLAPANLPVEPDFRAQSALNRGKFQPFLGSSKAVS